MAQSERFDDRQRRLAGFAKALAHPARVMILQFLAQRESCFCGQIVDELPLAQSTVSQHLRELKSVGLVEGAVDGVKVCYCLGADAVAAMRTDLAGLMDELNAATQTGECCPAD